MTAWIGGMQHGSCPGSQWCWPVWPRVWAALRALSDPFPWASGNRRRYVRLAWEELSGRQLGHDGDPLREPPVHGMPCVCYFDCV
jgi:hypothetical protein